MSLHINFDAHSWYMAFAIKDNGIEALDNIELNPRGYRWEAYTDNGNTYTVDTFEADTLGELKTMIKQYRSKER